MTPKNLEKTPKTTRSSRPARSSSAGWLLLLVIASGCMFYLGILVGRNTAPVHFDLDAMEKKLNNLQQSVMAENTASTKKIEHKLNENMPFDFYDNLKGQNAEAPIPQQSGDAKIKRPLFPKPPLSTLALAKVVANVTPVPSQPGIPAQPEQSSAPLSAQKPEAASKPPTTEAVSQAPAVKEPAPQASVQTKAPTQVEKPPATASQPASGGREYAIQVASLRDSKSANIIRDKFRAKGYPAYTQEAMVEGRGQWYRVRLGPYKDRAQAENDLARLQKAGVDAIIFLSDTNANSSASQGK